MGFWWVVSGIVGGVAATSVVVAGAAAGAIGTAVAGVAQTAGGVTKAGAVVNATGQAVLETGAAVSNVESEQMLSTAAKLDQIAIATGEQIGGDVGGKIVT